MQKIKNITYHLLSKDWAQLHRIEYDYEFKDGKIKRISRETYNRGDGVAILLYNPKKGTIILTRQFRMPIYDQNESEAMSIEACAGAIDKNESARSTIIREVLEEVGYEIHDAELVLEAYMSPGAMTEKLFLFVAEYHDDMKVNSGGGVDSEHEEIEVIELPFKDALEMVKDKKIIDAKTILLLQYAEINKLL